MPNGLWMVVALAGLIWGVVRKRDLCIPTDVPPITQPPVTLDMLKALRESAAHRWEKRREYEWKLSFGLWTAIAAFIAIVIGKENQIKDGPLVIGVIAVLGISITLLHFFYLHGIIRNTLNDLRKLEWVEEVMYRKLLPDLPAGVDAEWPCLNQGRILRYHGYLQAAITLVLCGCACAAIMAPKGSKPVVAGTAAVTNVSTPTAPSALTVPTPSPIGTGKHKP